VVACLSLEPAANHPEAIGWSTLVEEAPMQDITASAREEALVPAPPKTA